MVVNTTTENLAEAVAAATSGAGADLVLDHVGGQLFAGILPATRVGGTVINIGRLAGSQSTIDLDQLAFRRLRVQGTTFSVRTPGELGQVCAALVPDVLPAVIDGRIRPVIAQVFALDDAKPAARYLRSGQAAGKVIFEIS